MKELLKSLDKLNKIYDQFELLNFRAHKVLPLTFNKEDSKELLRQNKRLYFSYSYLNKEKIRLTNHILSQTVNLKDPLFKQNKMLHPKLIDKALKLKNIDQSHDKDTLEIPNRNRKINKLKQLIAMIQDEDIGLCQNYLTQMNVLIYQSKPHLFDERQKPYQSQELLQNIDFRTKIMQFDYDRYLFEEFTPEDFLDYLIFKKVQRHTTYIRSYDAKELIPEASDSGFSGIAYEIEIDGIRECYVTFKGTEADMDYTQRSRSKRLEKFLLEGFKDWNYNVNAILVGNDTENRQMFAARDFIKYIQDNIQDKCALYGLGHSLGGHFVQTLQLTDDCFKAGYTLNSAPINLKQVKLIQPDLFDTDTWDKLLKLTADKTTNMSPNNEIKRLLPREYPEIINESFEQDLTQVFYEIPSTIWLGKKLEYNLNNWKYPFKNHLASYLSNDEIYSYQHFFEQLFAFLQDSTTGPQLMRNTLGFIRARVKILHEDIEKPETSDFFYDYSNYLYQSGIFLDQPQQLTEKFNQEPNTMWKSSRLEWPFIKSLNMDMMELSVYFHIISGVKYFLNRKPNVID
ncbi:hypothetical protein M5C72_09235 [Companilactobacillus allii]|uniref:DUF6792 domain-containing protein n=1 Tax=Companilactobacillus allii TaxID=1847728 RepID=A0A1P8Q5W1_9LACO|nr:DUF6792 domain-containing protein [Companilactobacillus allii]APX73246.1 hypothetical protein BTM29_12120 [Companilactobacillus allii]USQ68059.1 hypothetical protein M5C72_09235 [Companilactobacillus allii]